jgi:hypothetical protein
MQKKETAIADLDTYVEERKDMPFAYGTNDCASFVCGAIQAMTDVDVFEEFRGTYSDEETSEDALITACGSKELTDVVVYITKKFDMPEIEAAYAQRGDVVLLGVEGGFALGIVALDGVNALVVSSNGLHRIGLGYTVRAWRV